MIVQQHLAPLRDTRKGNHASHIPARYYTRGAHTPVGVELSDETNFAPASKFYGGAHRRAGSFRDTG